MLFSERVKQIFPGFELDQQRRLKLNPETPRIKLSDLKETLLDRNTSRYAELNQKGLRFLNGDDMTGDKVALQSFPQAGCAFLQSILERVTGVYTGSDACNSQALN